MKQNREKDNQLYEKDQAIARLRNAYNKVKGDWNVFKKSKDR